MKNRYSMYSSSTKLVLLLLTCLVGLALARPISGEDLSIITKRTRNPRQLRSSLNHTQKFNRRGVEDTFEPEVDDILNKQLYKENTNNKKVAANPPVNYKKTSKAINDSFSKDEEAVDITTRPSRNSKQRKMITKAVTNEPYGDAERHAFTYTKPAAVDRTGHRDEQNDENNGKPFNAPFDSEVDTGIGYINKYNFHFEDTQPLTDGIEFLREQNQEGLAEEAQERAQEEEELRIASLRAQIAQRVRDAVGGLL